MTEPAARPSASAPIVRTLDIAEAWNAIFKDPDLVTKVLVGSVLMLASFLVIPLPFTLPVVLGYGIMTTRLAIAGEPHPMPQWQGFSSLWLLGIKLIFAQIVYLSPVVIAIGSGFTLLIVGAAIGRGGEPFAMAGVALFYIGIFGAQILSLVAHFTIFPTVRIHLAYHDELVSAFVPRRLWETFSRNPWNILITAVLLWAVSFVASFALCLCILPVFPVTFLGQMFGAAALGQSHRLKLEAYGELEGDFA